MQHTESCRVQLPRPKKLRGGSTIGPLVLAEIAGISSCATAAQICGHDRPRLHALICASVSFFQAEGAPPPPDREAESVIALPNDPGKQL